MSAKEMKRAEKLKNAIDILDKYFKENAYDLIKNDKENPVLSWKNVKKSVENEITEIHMTDRYEREGLIPLD